MTKKLFIGVIATLILLPGCSKQKEQAAVSKNLAVATIQLPTLKCKSCVRTINTALASVDGIESAEIHLEKKNATVQFLPAKLNLQDLKTAISKAGYDADDVKRDSTAYENLDACCK